MLASVLFMIAATPVRDVRFITAVVPIFIAYVIVALAGLVAREQPACRQQRAES